jgi:perosamine synthetase
MGYNYRLNELNGALGSVQMDRLDEIIGKRNCVAQKYNSRLSRTNGVTIPCISPEVTRMSWFVYVIRLDKSIDRNKVMKHLTDNGVACRPYFTPIHLQPYFRKLFGYKEGDFPVTEEVAASTIALPFYNDLQDDQIDYVVSVLSEGIEKYGLNVC